MAATVAPGQGPIEVTGHQGPKEIDQSASSQFSTSNQASYGQNLAQGSGFSQSYIPEYSQTPILESIAKQAQAMAPEVYQWGMSQYNKNQGNIDTMMRNAMAYASPQRIASEMGRAQAGVMQGAEAGRQSAIKDLQSYGIDPSSGRYAALDQASRVMAGAAAAGAGNQQREATTAQGTAMQQAAQGLSGQNYQTGYGAAQAATGLLGVASQLKYSPLGTAAGNVSESSGVTGSTGSTVSGGRSVTNKQVGWAGGGSIPDDNAPADDDATQGGFVSSELSPSAGAKVDDVDARLNSGEFVIPKDVAAWKGQEFFYKLMAQARKMRATAGQENGNGGMGYQENNGGNGSANNTGYQQGGIIDESNPWESREAYRSWREDPGIQGHADPRGRQLLDPFPDEKRPNAPYSTPVYDPRREQREAGRA